MGSPSDELVQRLLAALSDLPVERASRLVDEAWAEAEDGVRETLSTAMRAVLLRQVVAQVEGGAAVRPPPAEPPSRDPVPPAVAEPPPAPEPAPAEPAETPAPEEEPAAQGLGWYVYGVLEADAEAVPPGVVGIDGVHAVELVPAVDLIALTSAVPLDEFGPERLPDHLGDREWLEEKVRRHEEILRLGLAAEAMVPMRFCTIVRSSDALADFLAQHAEQLRAALAELRGREELGVKVLSDPERFGRHVEAESTEIRDLDARAAQQGAGAAYFLAKRREQLVAEETERVATTHVHDWHGRLAAVAERAAALPLRRPDDAGRELVLNGAYLVPGHDREAFEAEVEAIAGEAEAMGLDVELTGPWPAYTFVDVELAR